ncbi:MAG TPA: type II toxin-antitoxin system VapB family antitoxin [Steroidobacteraceae bacterium]|nr:type II toxin-antitoxin system VapB family antitoxin [Steroidobacteraceae bacterium]
MKKPPSKPKSAVSVRSSARTNVVLDAKLVAQVKRLSGAKTTREAIQLALEHYTRSRDYSRLLGLQGTGGVSEGYDPKTAYRS